MERQIPEIQITPPHWLPRGCFANSYPCVDSFSFSCLFSPSFSLSFFPLPFLYIYIFFLVLMAEETKKSFAPPRSPQFEATGNSEVKFNFSSSTNFDSSKLPEIKGFCFCFCFVERKFFLLFLFLFFFFSFLFFSFLFFSFLFFSFLFFSFLFFSFLFFSFLFFSFLARG